MPRMPPCRSDRHVAVDALVKDLRVFRQHSEELFCELTMLLTLDNFRCGGPRRRGRGARVASS